MKHRYRLIGSREVLLILALLLCLVPGLLSAQEFRATVTGHVTDPSGASVPNATVQARNTGTNEVATAITDAQGSYTIPFLKPGTYNLSIKGAPRESINR